MFFGMSSRLSSPEIVLDKKADQALYLIPKAWAFAPNVYDGRAGFSNQFNRRFRLRNGVGTIRITLDDDLELITKDCKAEIFLEITPENIQQLNIIGTPPKWLNYAWFKFELTDSFEEKLKDYVYQGNSGSNRHMLDVTLEQFITKGVGDTVDLGLALKRNPLFQPAFGFASDNIALVRNEFYNGISLNNKQIVHHHMDGSFDLITQDQGGEEPTKAGQAGVWVNQRLKFKKELIDTLEERILNNAPIAEEEIVQVFGINNPENKVMLMVRNRFSNEVSSHLMDTQQDVAKVTKLSAGDHPYASVFYEYRSKDYEVVAVMSGNSKFANLDIFTTDPDVLTALFETEDRRVKFHVADNFDELKKIVEIKEDKAIFDIVLYNGELNVLSLPVESAAIAGEIVEFLEDYLETEEGNW